MLSARIVSGSDLPITSRALGDPACCPRLRSPVTTRDVIATLKRLFLRDSQIQSLAQRVATLEAIDDGIHYRPQGAVLFRRVCARRVIGRAGTAGMLIRI